MPEPTPGQRAYAAWHAIVIPGLCPGYLEDWSQVSALEQRAWDAAAQAVLAQVHQQEVQMPRCRWCGQEIAAHPQEGGRWRCRLSDGPLLPREDTP